MQFNKVYALQKCTLFVMMLLVNIVSSEVFICLMVKPGNCRVIATLTPKAQINLSYLEDKTDLSKSTLIQLAINYYAELVRKEKV